MDVEKELGQRMATVQYWWCQLLLLEPIVVLEETARHFPSIAEYES